MKLYYVPRSRSTRVLWTLEELGVPYELVVMAPEERHGEEHRKRHPLGRVPVIEFDDGRLLFESAAICLQLADLHPDAGLMPPVGSAERALAYQWTFFAMTELEKRVFDWLFASRRGEDVSEHATGFEPLHKALTDGLGDKPWLTGESFTVADLLCATMLANAYHRELLTDGGPLQSFAQCAQARPAAQRAEAIDVSHR
jgi:glutathione S-transferase